MAKPTRRRRGNATGDVEPDGGADPTTEGRRDGSSSLGPMLEMERSVWAEMVGHAYDGLTDEP